MLGKLLAAVTRWTETLARRRAARRHARLLAVIEGQILPRLVIATGSQRSHRTGPDSDAEPTSENVVELARLLIEHDATVAAEYLQVLRTQGASVESLWMQLVAPTARYLNKLATSGDLDVARIASAQGRLHSLLHDLEVRQHAPALHAEAAGELSPGG